MMGKGGMITRPKADLRRGGQGASAREEQRNRERERGREQRGAAWEWRRCRSEGGRRRRMRKKGGRRGQRRSVAVKEMACVRREEGEVTA